jgi:uncharacterized protein YdiU (UPF0061 family)
MRAVNPAVIPRNHTIETILAEYEASGESSLKDAFLEAFNDPYVYDERHFEWLQAPKDYDKNYQTFCGT